jgi:hypothetical protein
MQVAGVLSSLFLEENLKVREERAQGASKFLGEEAAGMQEQLAAIDAKIARYKEKHVNELPELLQVNLSSVDRVEREINAETAIDIPRRKLLSGPIGPIPARPIRTGHFSRN